MCIEPVYSSFVKPETKLIAMLKATAIILSFLDHVKLSAGYIHVYIILRYSGGACGCQVAEAQYDTPSDPPDIIPLLDRLAVAEAHHDGINTRNQAEAQPLKGPHSLENQLKKRNGTRQ